VANENSFLTITSHPFPFPAPNLLARTFTLTHFNCVKSQMRNKLHCRATPLPKTPTPLQQRERAEGADTERNAVRMRVFDTSFAF